VHQKWNEAKEAKKIADDNGKITQTMKPRNFQLLLSAFASFFMLVSVDLLYAQGGPPKITLSIEPQRSTNGEPIRFRIQVESPSGNIQQPKVPKLDDWEITNSYVSQSRNAQIINGKFMSTSRSDFTYILKPLRKGKLPIPSFEVQVGNTTLSTPATSVEVENLPGGLAQRPRTTPTLPPPTGTRNPDPFQLQQQPPTANNDPLPEKESFFVRAEPDKIEAFVGELIKLDFALYQRQQLRLDEPAIGKFPDFRGFLKEELEIPRKFTPIPTVLQGETLYRSDLFKYAIFPLRSGKLTIQPMLFRATLLPSEADLLRSLMGGGTFTPPNTSGIPMEKSSRELTIHVKELPPAPPGNQFTGAVGSFDIELTPPNGKLTVDQPFNLTLTIAGRGNVKAIEEPILDLPKNVEPYQTRNQYEFRSDATGYKSFEYLLLPRSPGSVTIPPMNWAYFDPALQEYKILSTKEIQLTIEGTSSSVASGDTESDRKKTPKLEGFEPWVVGNQKWVQPSTSSSAGFDLKKINWSLQLLGYLAAFTLFIQRRRQQKLSLFYNNKPWAKTEHKILEKNEWDNKDLSLLIDQWMREKLWDLLSDSELNTESSRDDFLQKLEPKISPEKHAHLGSIKKLWNELDVLRFTGTRSQKASAKSYLDKAKATVRPFE